MELDKKNTNLLLWTSGWDSTYRLLELVLIKKEIVQPIYILDDQRKSLKNELIAIEKILYALHENHPASKKLILPIKYYSKKDIVIKPEIKAAFEHVRNFIKIGSQYDWISSLCEQENLKDVELCIFKNERTDILFNYINSRELDDAENLFNKEENETKEAVKLIFKHYLFPVLTIDKMDMYAVAKENNWLDLMKMTWFCHRPKNGKPCGKCNPCTIAIVEGLGFRIPIINRLKGYYKLFIKKIKKL
jgi:7-cyano-7-deazaguanine synthase in queuosine biosynthesis